MPHPPPVDSFRWPVNHDIVRKPGHLGGWLPADGDPRRCQATTRWGLQCTRWACHYENYCWLHHKGGLHRRRRKMAWYGRRAGSKLRDALNELQKEKKELHDLDEEMLAARMLADKALELFEKACMGDVQVSSDLQALAAAHAREAISHVASIVEKSAKVRAVSAALIGPEDVVHVADQMARAVCDVLKKHGIPEAVGDEVATAIEAIRLPRRDVPQVVVSVT